MLRKCLCLFQVSVGDVVHGGGRALMVVGSKGGGVVLAVVASCNVAI